MSFPDGVRRSGSNESKGMWEGENGKREGGSE